MISEIASSENNSEFLTSLMESAVEGHVIYHIAYRIFREIWMAVQYVNALTCITLRNWFWSYKAIPAKYLVIQTQNIAALQVLKTCFASAWQPFPKERYHLIGRSQGFRVTHDMMYRPASGLCLGMCLTFLAEYFSITEGTDRANLLAAAKVLQSGGNETCVMIQSIYDALMGVQGKFDSQEKLFFLHLLQGAPNIMQETKNKELKESVNLFLGMQDQPQSFRRFILDDLDSKGVQITPELYALTLELDAEWERRLDSSFNKYDCVHQEILNVISGCLNLESANLNRIKGKIPAAEEYLDQLVSGAYLIQFHNHTIALAKGEDCIALFEPKEGLALFKPDDQQEILSQILGYYSTNDLVDLKVIEIYPSDSNERT